MTGTLAWTTYTTGGDSIAARDIGMSRINSFEIKGDDLGFDFSESINLDQDTVAVKVFQTASSSHNHSIQVTQDEVVSVTAGTGVSSALTNIPVSGIDSVYITAGGVTGPVTLVPVGSVSSSKQASLNYTTGVFQFLVADAVTSIKVTYQRSAVTSTSIAATPESEVPNGTNLALAGLTSVAFEATGSI